MKDPQSFFTLHEKRDILPDRVILHPRPLTDLLLSPFLVIQLDTFLALLILIGLLAMILLSLQMRILRFCKPKISLLKQCAQIKKSVTACRDAGRVSLRRRTGVNNMGRSGVSLARSNGVCIDGISTNNLMK